MKKSKINFIIIPLVFILSLIAAKESMALTEILPGGDECLITIRLRKQFRVTNWTTIDKWINEADQWINEIQGEIDGVRAQMNAIANPGRLRKVSDFFSTEAGRNAEWQELIKKINDLQVELNFDRAKKAALEKIKSDNITVTDPELENLAAKWKQEIESKWNLPDYKYNNCCHVKVQVDVKTNGPPDSEYDQIDIVPGDFRSYITGVGGFDASGFSNNPYKGSITGIWSKNTIDDYEAPHEAGHEMGIRDWYTDPATGGSSVPVTGHEKDLLGGIADLANLQPVGVGFDNLKIVLDGKNAFCPPKCCDAVGINVGTGIISIGAKPRDTSSVPCPSNGEEASSPVIPDTSRPQKPEITEQPITEQPKDINKAKDVEAVQPREALQQTSTNVDGTRVDTGIHYQDTPGGGMRVDTTSLATGGKGPDFRKWEVTDTTMFIDGQKVKPVKKDKFYVPKVSAMRNSAVAVFVALGAQYGDYAKEAESGQVCPVTGKPKSESMEKSGMDRAIDKAGMAAGLGLLASQAKGEITGQRCFFNLDKQQAQKLKEGKAVLKVRMEHMETSAMKNAEMPLGKVFY